MKRLAPLAIILLALVAALFSLFGGDSFSHLHTLEGSLSRQNSMNQELEKKVTQLKREIVGLQKDDRVLEKIVRTELGMAKPDEMIIIFDDSKAQRK